MGLNDSIGSLATHREITVTRRQKGTYTNGIYTSGATSTFKIDAVIQPAYNLNRVIGGADLAAKVDNQRTNEVRVLYTTTELMTRTKTTDPDVLTFEGGDWTAIRDEAWDLAGEVHYRVIISRQTQGAA